MSRSKKDVQPHWRPNFVNASELPDIKAVRTGFIINFVAVVLLLMVGFYLLQREYHAYSLAREIEEMEQRIQISEPDDVASLKVSREFRELAENVSELELFYTSPVRAHELLTELARIRPEKIIYTRLSMAEILEKDGKKSFVGYRINIAGEVDETALEVLGSFKQTLEDWEFLDLGDYEKTISDSLQGRDAVARTFPFTLEIQLKPGSKKSSSGTEGGDEA